LQQDDDAGSSTSMPLGESKMRFDNYNNNHEIGHFQINSKIIAAESSHQKDCKMTTEEQLY
jgi:hypothetical protein